MFAEEIRHEQVLFAQDRASGLRTIIGIYSTALGPALGGTRFYPYRSEEEALADVLHLSEGMAYKAAMAGLPLGGGKAVILGDPDQDKTEELLRAYGRVVQGLGGQYITACDVGTTVADMDVVSEVCQWVTGRSPVDGGAGDSSVLTAFGVLQGMRAAASWRWNRDSLAGLTVGIAGVGKVGRHLVGHLLEEGARVLAADVNGASTAALMAEHPGVTLVEPESLASSPMDVFAPCALGGALTERTVASLQAEIVCGAANNQLAQPEVGALLDARGILYAPDYVVNAGGLIQVYDERIGFDFDRAKQRTTGIYQTLIEVFTAAKEEGLPPALAADRLAERRMSAGPQAA